MITAIIGSQWGDEGKGKIVDLLAEEADLVIRFNGGNNAGHTVINQYGRTALHLIPSGIFNAKTICVIGNGAVIHPPSLWLEIKELIKKGISLKNLKISSRAHLVMPWHLILDGLQENSRGQNKIGTTNRGIGPAYMDKISREGLRMIDLLDKKTFKAKSLFLLKEKLNFLKSSPGKKINEFEREIDEYLIYGQKLKKFIIQTEFLIWQATEKNKKIFLEGAQGTFLDLDFGTYPFVTSSYTTSAGACLGSGIPPLKIDEVTGVTKAYTTRVGEGPFPTELKNQLGKTIREKGNEYGATTGRPRRCGWFDAVLVRYASLLNGFGNLALTKLDILDFFKTIKICTAYQLNGKQINYPPPAPSQFFRLKPVYEELKGWQKSTIKCRSFGELPKEAKKYLKRIEELVRVKIKIISVGAKREETIRL